jgi:hypothetical protein
MELNTWKNEIKIKTQTRIFHLTWNIANGKVAAVTMYCMCHEDIDQGFFWSSDAMILCRDTCAYIVHGFICLER